MEIEVLLSDGESLKVIVLETGVEETVFIADKDYELVSVLPSIFDPEH
jgi:hypothetical protein